MLTVGPNLGQRQEEGSADREGRPAPAPTKWHWQMHSQGEQQVLQQLNHVLRRRRIVRLDDCCSTGR